MVDLIYTATVVVFSICLSTHISAGGCEMAEIIVLVTGIALVV
jgi:hypothetical protein